MDNKTIIRLKEETEACGHSQVRIRDVGFAILNRVLHSPKMAYAMMFPSSPEDSYREYASSPMQKTLSKRVDNLLRETYAIVEPAKSVKKESANPDEITADENRREMMAMLKEIKEEKNKTDADLPKLLKIEADIRTKLKDKFEVSASAEQQLIVVQPKCNHICEQTGRECWLQTREYAMEHWNLKPADE